MGGEAVDNGKERKNRPCDWHHKERQKENILISLYREERKMSNDK
jgi:hypothetical protein